jgi:hypothetical protein
MFAVLRDLHSLGELWLPWVIDPDHAGPRQVQIAEIATPNIRYALEHLNDRGGALLIQIERIKDSLSDNQGPVRGGPFIVFRTLEGPVLSEGYAYACAIYELGPKVFEFEMEVRTPPAGHPLTASGIRDLQTTTDIKKDSSSL